VKLIKHTYKVTFILKDGTRHVKEVDATCEGNAAARVIALTKAIEVTHIKKES
jgi:hypothetical protein